MSELNKVHNFLPFEEQQHTQKDLQSLQLNEIRKEDLENFPLEENIE